MEANPLKAAWDSRKPTIGLWMVGASGIATEQAAALEFDYFCVDLQHGVYDYQRGVEILQALRAGGACAPIARVPWNEPGIIGKVLDAGVVGVIIPMVNTADEARAAVAACRYAPLGSRSYGPARAATVFGAGYFDNANEQLACIPMIETKQAIENLDEISDVEGIDALYIGPADLSVSYGLTPGSDNAASEFQQALSLFVETCEAKAIVPGIHAAPGLVQKRLDQGFRMVTATSDLLAFMAGAKSALAMARGESTDSGSNAVY